AGAAELGCNHVERAVQVHVGQGDPVGGIDAGINDRFTPKVVDGTAAGVAEPGDVAGDLGGGQGNIRQAVGVDIADRHGGIGGPVGGEGVVGPAAAEDIGGA